jgi:uncharacterized sulfatase
VLQKNGYRTALVGKWHLGDQPPFHPTRLGFDHFMGFLGGGARTMRNYGISKRAPFRTMNV